MNELLRLANKKSTLHPELKDEIDKLLNLCFDDIDNGRPEIYEIELCYESIKQLVKVEDVVIKKKSRRKSKKNV